jgi:hypothetical protein
MVSGSSSSLFHFFAYICIAFFSPNWLLLSGGISILFALVIRPSQLILLLPKHTLQTLDPVGSPDRSITLVFNSHPVNDVLIVASDFVLYRDDWLIKP